MQRSKGQSAIEYLTTYGWMLLVVAVIGGAFYALTQGQCQETVSSQFDNSLTVTDFGLNTENNMDIMLRNTYNEPITVHEVTISQDSGNRSIQPGAFLSVSEKEPVELEGFRQVNGCNTLDLRVKYSAGSLENITTEGSLTAPISIDSNPLPTDPTGGEAST
jgi:hypothetical protein